MNGSGHGRPSGVVEHSNASLAQQPAGTLLGSRTGGPHLMTDVETIRNRARHDSGAITFAYGPGCEEAMRLSNAALAPGMLRARASRAARTHHELIRKPWHGLILHTPNPQSDPDPPEPGPEIPNPTLPPDMEPVVPQQDPPPGRGIDPEPPPIIAHIAYAWTSILH